MLHNRFKSGSSANFNGENGCDENEASDRNKSREKDKLEKGELCVNGAKLGALIYFPLIGIALTSCIGDMYHRNHNMHREPNSARSLVIDCPVHDPDDIWRLLVASNLVIIFSIIVLCGTMMGSTFYLVDNFTQGPGCVCVNTNGNIKKATSARSRRMRVLTCRICLLLIYCGMYHYDVCMGNMPYLKKKVSQLYLTCIILFISSPTLSMPVIMRTSGLNPSKPPRWPLFIIKMMVFIPYFDAGWYKLYHNFSSSTLQAALMNHYMLFESPIASLFIDYPVLCSVASFSTLTFECAGWVLVFLDYDRVAAAVALSFHFGIYLAMNINYLLFWGCSFVFFFVPSIISSVFFQHLVKRLDEEKSVLVPVLLGRSFRIEIEGEVKEVSSAARSSLTNEGPKSKRDRKSTVRTAVCCALFLTFKMLTPSCSTLPSFQQPLRPYYLDRLYERMRDMMDKPFNSYIMFSSNRFPQLRTVAYLNFKEMASEHTSSDREAAPAPSRRVKWISNQHANEYFFTNIMGHDNNAHRIYKLNSFNVTKCNILACLAQRYIFDDTTEDTIKDGSQRLRRKMVVSDGWDIESIELVQETYSETTGLMKEDFDTKSINKGEDVVKTLGPGSLQKELLPLCMLDVGDDRSHNTDGDLPRYENKFCADILAELDASAKSVESSSQQNPFHLVQVVPRARKRHSEDYAGSLYTRRWTVYTAMLCIGLKTYLLAR